MLLQEKRKHRSNESNITNLTKTLSKRLRFSNNICNTPRKQIEPAKAWCDVHLKQQKGTLVVEAAVVVPLFLFASVLMLGLFSLILVEVQVGNALQYTARTVAVSYRDAQKEHDVLSLAEGEVVFRHYLKEHGCNDDAIAGGKPGISLLQSDFSGDYVVLCASYRVKLPISAFSIRFLPVSQTVKAKKWTGASENDAGAESGDEGAVYVTKYGHAYHESPDCPYLKLSIHTVTVRSIGNRRNEEGSIYYKCSCYHGGPIAYITDYGTSYHGSLDCGGLKRTTYQTLNGDVGNRHRCPKCAGGN